MKRLLLALTLLATPAWAVDYVKPASAPQVFVPNHGVTVSVFAVATAVGQGLGVFEQRGTGWYLCGTCLVNAQYPTLDAAVSAAGGAGPYIEAQRAAINAVLASRYPAVAPPPTTALGAVNQALGAYRLSIVNDAPVLGPN